MMIRMLKKAQETPLESPHKMAHNYTDHSDHEGPHGDDLPWNPNSIKISQSKKSKKTKKTISHDKRHKNPVPKIKPNLLKEMRDFNIKKEKMVESPKVLPAP